MAVEASVLPLSYLAGANLSASQFHFVMLSTAADDTVLLCTAGSNAIGVLDNKPPSGRAAAVNVQGRVKVVYGASVTRGDPLTSDSTGRAITQTGQNPICAYAEESGAVNEIHNVLMVARPLGTGVGGSTVSIPVSLPGITAATFATYTPGYAGTIKKVTYVPTVASSTAAKAATVTPNINSTPVTGGVLALTTANTNTLGTNVAGSAVTAANTFGATDAINLVGSAVTAFIEGSGAIVIELQ